jgi:hypothetical protein
MLPFLGGWLKPVPAPDSTKELDSSNINDGGSNQKLILFNRGKAISTQYIFWFNQNM